VLQIGMFVTPVGYRTDFLPNWRDWLALNPLTSMVEGFRWCLLGGRTEFYERGLFLSLAVTAIMLIGGLWYFRKTERQFADVI
jgi:lipopolysaccharide transport system permease protein